MLNKIGSILQSRKAPQKEVEQAYNSVYDNADHCVSCGRVIPEGSQVCIICGLEKAKKQTQYDRIRKMSIDEMTEYIYIHNDMLCDKICHQETIAQNRVCPYFAGDETPKKFCVNCIKRWLLSEVEE